MLVKEWREKRKRREGGRGRRGGVEGNSIDVGDWMNAQRAFGEMKESCRPGGKKDCGDYKRTLRPEPSVAPHPRPTVPEILPLPSLGRDQKLTKVSGGVN